MNVENKNTRARLYGLLGQSISYSKSPALYEKWFQNIDFECRFILEDRNQLDVSDFIHLTKIYDGLCVTIPYKKVIFEFLNQLEQNQIFLSDCAFACGAVNVLKFSEHGIFARNTDAEALFFLLQKLPEIEKSVSKGLKKALILGDGGAAAATKWALQNCKDSQNHIQITSACRTPKSNEAIAFSVETIACHLHAHPTDIIVNATPFGSGRQNSQIFLDILNSIPEPYPLLVVDWVYGEESTELIKWAQQRDIAFIDGATLLETQAKLSFEFWFDEHPQ